MNKKYNDLNHPLINDIVKRLQNGSFNDDDNNNHINDNKSFELNLSYKNRCDEINLEEDFYIDQMDVDGDLERGCMGVGI